MKDATKACLQRFFAPHNALLEQLLGIEWKGVWQYNASQIIQELIQRKSLAHTTLCKWKGVWHYIS